MWDVIFYIVGAILLARANYLYGRSAYEAGEYGGPFVPVWISNPLRRIYNKLYNKIYIKLTSEFHRTFFTSGKIPYSNYDRKNSYNYT